MTVVIAAILLALLAFASTPATALMPELEQRFATQREPYREALDALKRGDERMFERLSSGLDSYPLAPYLEYQQLLKQRYRLDGSRARRFVEAHDDSPLGVRFLGHYLEAAGASRRWADYLDAAQREPRGEELRCYYHRAQFGQGQRDAAWEGAARLWRSGRSVDEACDPLFSAWRSAGQLDDTAVWDRALLAYDARQRTLLRYVASFGSDTLQPDLELLQRSYSEPRRTQQLAQGASPERRADILASGLVRLSRYDPAGALTQLQAQKAGMFSGEQSERLQSAIALRGLIDRDEGVRAWLDANLAAWDDDRLSEMRLRWAIAEQDWNGILLLSQMLEADTADSDLWRYWRARALEATADTSTASALYAAVATSRSYYGFLAADRVGVPYSFNESPAPVASGLRVLPPLALQTASRVHELQAIGESRDAHAEWSHTLPRVDRSAQRQLAALAAEAGWYRFAIDATNMSRSPDALALRFPLAYTDVFRIPAAQQSVPVSELMAIARRESAFFPDARSAVGARGLMQLMPKTGISLARSQGLRLRAADLYDVERNIGLGSVYYRQLLERFSGNRAVALAAYNAGPNRVKHWVGRGLPLDAWIETIPYGETRDYVKAVLAYSVVFVHRLGQEARLLSASESAATY